MALQAECGKLLQQFVWEGALLSIQGFRCRLRDVACAFCATKCATGCATPQHSEARAEIGSKVTAKSHRFCVSSRVTRVISRDRSTLRYEFPFTVLAANAVIGKFVLRPSLPAVEDRFSVQNEPVEFLGVLTPMKTERTRRKRLQAAANMVLSEGENLGHYHDHHYHITAMVMEFREFVR